MSQPTFTEAELTKIADFLNFVHQKAEFPSCAKPSEARKLTVMLNDMAAHLKKCEGYMLEIKEVKQEKAVKK